MGTIWKTQPPKILLNEETTNLISRLQGPSSLGAFGQCGVGCRVWFIGKWQATTLGGIWSEHQFGVGS